MSNFLSALDVVSAPRIASPRGACDCHFHVFDNVARFPFVAQRGFTPALASLEGWRRMAQTLGLTRGVLVQPSPYGRDNALLMHLLDGRPELRGVAAPPVGATIEDMRAMHERGVRGVRVNHFLRNGRPIYEGGLDLAALEPLLPMIAALGWHVELWLNVAQDLPSILPDLADWPDVPLVFDHMGCLDSPQDMRSAGFTQLLALVESGRAWVKLSGIHRLCPGRHAYANARPVFEALMAARTDRMLWGTNWPHPHITSNMPDDGELFSLFNEWVPQEPLRRAILASNPACLYGFDAEPLTISDSETKEP